LKPVHMASVKCQGRRLRKTVSTQIPQRAPVKRILKQDNLLYARRHTGARITFTYMAHSFETPGNTGAESAHHLTREDAERMLDILDTLVDTHGQEARVLRNTIIRTAQTFVGCITESTMLDEKDIMPGTPWHDKEEHAHDAFEKAIHALFAFEKKYGLHGVSYDIPFDESILDHLHTNMLAVHIVSQLSTHRHRVAA
jgi:hypothetical protein